MRRCLVTILLAILSSSVTTAEDTISLFDGKTLNGWVTLDDNPVTKGWEVVDGTIHIKIEKERAGYIKTTRSFENFELEFEWRVAEGGNSGVKYLAKESNSDRGLAYYGCEYQLLDDKKHKNGGTPNKTAGSLYDLYAPDASQKQLNPVDKFNHSRVVVDNGRVEHWLNGKKILEATIGSEDWRAKVAKSKVSSVQDFAIGPGVILLQEHLSEAWFRNIRLTPLPETANRRDDATADVIVYGSTPGGFCAAIAAAREGASVILLEPTDHVGAMNTGGLSHCDSNQMVRSTVMGLFDEWHTRVVKDYTDRGLKAPYNPAIKDQSRWTFEPHVAMRVTKQMLDEVGVTVLTERYLKSVTKDGPRITSLVTKNGTFTARVFVDGTYEGDLLAAAGVDWTIGREGRDEYDESLAGKQYPKQKMNIDGFDDKGKLLPLVTTDNAGEKEGGDKNVMTYSFRLCLTEDPDNRMPMPKPEHYDPARFEVVRRALKAGEKRVGFDLYPLPGNKLDGNNSIGGQFSIGLVGGGDNWHSSDQAGRKKIWEAHKQYTLEFFHFLTNDSTVPAVIRNRFTKLGLCKDEFPTYDHFSPALYVRESRRMIGRYVISQKDILESPEKDDPIAISSFPIDSHDCQRIALKGGGVINEGTIFPVRRKNPKQGYAYHVPYRSILPKPEQCDNLLVPVALSCTHVGISSLRIEGAWMVIGQSAGIAAALAADQNVAVQELDYAKLRERLLIQKQALELPEVSDEPSSDSISAKKLPGIVLDDTNAKLTGDWSRSSNFKPHIESGYIFSGEKDSKTKGDGKATATFRFKAPKSGQYQLLMAYSAHESRAKNVPVTVSSGDHRKTIEVDQTRPLPSGKHFRLIDMIELQENVETVIQITNADTTGFVILDAVQLLPVE